LRSSGTRLRRAPWLHVSPLVETSAARLWSFRRYSASCGLLLLPAIVWNVAFASFLPPAFQPAEFWRNIPNVLAFSENTLRVAVFVLPFCMPLRLNTQRERTGILVFAAGSVLYFASWLALIAFPASSWATSAVGFLAPAYTPIVWLFGLALLGGRLFWGHIYRWWVYLVLALLFDLSHVSHAFIVYSRNYPA